jgi:hypothetical protein
VSVTYVSLLELQLNDSGNVGCVRLIASAQQHLPYNGNHLQGKLVLSSTAGTRRKNYTGSKMADFTHLKETAAAQRGTRAVGSALTSRVYVDVSTPVVLINSLSTTGTLLPFVRDRPLALA